MLLDSFRSKGPWGTSEEARPKIKSFGVIGDGHSGSEPLMTPSGRELIMLAISKKTVCSCKNVREVPLIFFSIDLFVNFRRDSLRPFWCWPSAGAAFHCILFLAAQSWIGCESHCWTNSAISFVAETSWDLWSDWISPVYSLIVMNLRNVWRILSVE